MTLVPGKLAILFEHQPNEGILAPGFKVMMGALPGAVTDAGGLVLGVTSAGIAESGIDYQLTRSFVDAGTTDDGLTRKHDGFLDAQVTTLTLAFPLAGNKEVISGTPAADEFQFDIGLGTADFGIASILRACGLGVGAGAPVGEGWRYTPEAATFASCLIFDSGMVYPFIDLKGSLEMSLTPGEAGVQTATFLAKLLRNPLDANEQPQETPFPTTDYGAQDNVAAPIIELGGNTLGPIRGWSDLTINIDNQIVTTPDCNAIAGVRVEQDGREIGFTVTLDQDDTDTDFDYQNLVSDANGDDMTMQFGADNAGDNTEAATAVALSLNNVNIQTLGAAQPARARSSQIDAFATGQVDGADFHIELR